MFANQGNQTADVRDRIGRAVDQVPFASGLRRWNIAAGSTVHVGGYILQRLIGDRDHARHRGRKAAFRERRIEGGDDGRVARLG